MESIISKAQYSHVIITFSSSGRNWEALRLLTSNILGALSWPWAFIPCRCLYPGEKSRSGIDYVTCARVSLLHHNLLPESSLLGGSNSTCAFSFQSSAASLSGLLLPPSVPLFWKYDLGFPPLHAQASSPLAESHHLSVHAYAHMLTYVPIEKYLLGFCLLILPPPSKALRGGNVASWIMLSSLERLSVNDFMGSYHLNATWSNHMKATQFSNKLVPISVVLHTLRWNRDLM